MAPPAAAHAPDRPRSGGVLPRRLRRHSFRVLLLPLLVLYVIIAIPDVLPLDALFARLAWVAVIVSCLFALSGEPRVLRAGVVFAAVMLGLDWLSPWVAPRLFRVAHLALIVAFLAWMVAVVLREVLARKTALNADALLGAACGYLLLVLVFADLYQLLEIVAPGSLLLGGQLLPAEETVRVAILHYFSAVTLTTLGYGDVVPVTPTARLVAGGEALVGQLYVAILIAALVGLGRRAPVTPSDGADDR